jgi:hypothetical protein
MVIFHSYVKLPEGKSQRLIVKNPLFSWKKVPTVHGHIPMLEHMKKPDL